MPKTIKITETKALPDTGSEEHDIFYSMEDEAKSSIEWIKDCILRQHMRNANDRVDAKTRKLIQSKAYETYIKMSKKIHKKLNKAANDLLKDI